MYILCKFRLYQWLSMYSAYWPNVYHLYYTCREMKKENPTRGCCSFLCCCCVNPPQALIQVDVLNAHGLEKQDMTGAGKIFHNYNA